MPSTSTTPAAPKTPSSAKARADRAYRQRLVESGQCVRCGRTRESDATGQRCRRCTAKAAESAWQRRQRTPRGRMGPAPKDRTIHGWNFDTDDLIVSHVRLAKALAWRMALRYDGIDVDDLIGDALYGLVVAGRTYDASYQVPFGAWATSRIKGEMHDGVRRWTRSQQKQPPIFVAFEDNSNMS